MSILGAVWSYFTIQRRKNSREEPASIVFLQRSPEGIRRETIIEATQRALWTPQKHANPQAVEVNLVAGKVSLVSAERHVLSILRASRPYELEGISPEEWTSRPDALEAWQRHTAWIAFNYLSTDRSVAQAHSALAAITRELLTENCLGVYFPLLGEVYCNDRRLLERLSKMRGTRDLCS